MTETSLCFPPSAASLKLSYHQMRALTVQLTQTLTAEDMTVQVMPDASPTKWHLAHTSWFFETFLLKPHLPNYEPYSEVYNALFNSYYQAVGPQYPRPQRGLLTRPSLLEVMEYRDFVDHHMQPVLMRAEDDAGLAWLVILGLQHEQQHQELILTDIKALFFCNPLYPAYRPALCSQSQSQSCRWISYDEGMYEIGHAGEDFAFDNEMPRHKMYLDSFQLASRLVTNGEYLAFMEARGYEQPHYWLANGWDTAQREHWRAPLYWVRQADNWQEYTLSGLRPLMLAEPVCHVSFYEASAFACWMEARLPTETEWEAAAQQEKLQGRFLDMNALHPHPADGSSKIDQLFGDAWEWTQSSYLPYPGYHPPNGAIGEYNGKFMCNQMVLRGGSCATPPGHIRPSYRNFFYPSARWQFSGIRLARNSK